MFLGRAAEFEHIEGLLRRGRAGTSAALLVHGDAGIGKSTLLEQVVDAAAGFQVLRTRSLQAESELPFAGLADLLRPLFGLLDRIPAPQADVLLGAFALGPPAPRDRLAAATATLSLLSAGAEQGPVLAVVDDVHWLDSSSREALLFAARRLGAEGIVLLLATRGLDWVADSPIPRFGLDALDPATTSQLITLSGRAVSGAVRERLITETAGNPLAVREALAALTDAQLAGTAPIAAPVSVGPDLEQWFVLRLAKLSDEERRALLLAATSTSGDVSEIARSLAAVHGSWAAVEACERAGLVTLTAGTLEFCHPLLRSAVYHAAEPTERRGAHLALANGLHPNQAAQVAWHLAGAAAGPDEHVAGLLEESGLNAQARSGYAAAAAALVTASRLSPDGRDRLRRSMAAANALRLGGEPQLAADVLADVLHLAPDPLSRADVQALRGSVLVTVGAMMEVFALLTDEASLVEAHDPTRAALLLATAAVAAVGAAEVTISLETSQRAAQLAQGGPVAAFAAIVLSNSLALAGRVAEAKTIVAPLIPLLETLDPLTEAGLLLAHAAHTLVWVESWPAAALLLNRVIDTCRAASALTLLAFPLSISCEMLFRQGRIVTAYTTGSEAVQICRDTGQHVELGLSLMCVARVEALLGRESDCRSHLDEAMEICRRKGVVPIESYVASVLGALELSLGRPELAAGHLQVCERLERSQGVRTPTVVPWLPDFIESLAESGRTAEATAVLAVLDGQARDTGLRWAAATAARCRGILAGHDDFESCFAEAIELHGQDAFELGRTQFALGIRRRRAQRPAEAKAVLHQALRTFEELGAQLWADRVRSELLATGESPRPAIANPLSKLTPQELQIALIVAEGATNGEVAAALFLSAKTVEYHLSNVYRKLAVRSRTELARTIARLA